MSLKIKEYSIPLDPDRKLPFILDKKRNFTNFNQIEAMDYILETTANFFARNYNTDYFSVHSFNDKNDIVMGMYNHNTWNQYLIDNNTNITDNYIDIYKLPHVTKNQSYFETLDFILEDTFTSHKEKSQINIRAEIIGDRKYGGFNLLLSNDQNYKTIYDVTFKDNISPLNLSQKIGIKFMMDMKKCENVLQSLVEHGSIYGDFNDTRKINILMDQWRKDFAFLLA